MGLSERQGSWDSGLLSLSFQGCFEVSMCEGWAVMLPSGRPSLGTSGPNLRNIHSLSFLCWWSELLGTITSSLDGSCTKHTCPWTTIGFYGNSTNFWPWHVSRKVQDTPKITEPEGSLFFLMLGYPALADKSSFALLFLIPLSYPSIQ